MIRNIQRLAATATLIVLSGVPTCVLAISDDASLDRAVRGPATSGSSTWLNALLPQASGDYIAPNHGVSADQQFMRAIAYYTRDMLDRGGWVNAYVSEQHYAAGNLLFAARVGEGVTSRSQT